MRERDENLVAYLREALAEGVEREEKCPILFALHIGCGALALGLRGPIEPARREEAGDGR